MSGQIKDFEGNPIEIGDAVTILIELDNDNPLKSLDSLKIGEIIGFTEDSIEVQIDEESDYYNYTKISKVRPEETLDEMIIRIANNLEVLKLMQESNILDSMLQGEIEEEVE